MEGALLVAASIVPRFGCKARRLLAVPQLVAVASDSVLLARTAMAAIERES
jgi:hypothetical protein